MTIINKTLRLFANAVDVAISRFLFKKSKWRHRTSDTFSFTVTLCRVRLHCLGFWCDYTGNIFHLAPRLAHLLKINTAIIPPHLNAPKTATELRYVIHTRSTYIPKTEMYTKRRQEMLQKKQKQAKKVVGWRRWDRGLHKLRTVNIESNRHKRIRTHNCATWVKVNGRYINVAIVAHTYDDGIRFGFAVRKHAIYVKA